MGKTAAPEVARLLLEYGRRTALAGGNPYRVKAYLRAAESLANSMLVQNAVWLGIAGPDLDSAVRFAGQQGWIENGANDTTVLTPAGYAAGRAPIEAAAV